MYKVHMYLDSKRIVCERMPHIPRVKDTVRLNATVCVQVVEVVWCLDEPSMEGQRVNIRLGPLEE